MSNDTRQPPSGPQYPQTKAQWVVQALRYWSLVNELDHYLETGRIVVTPGTDIAGRRSVKGFFQAVRDAAASAPFHPHPDDIDDTPGGAA